MRKSIHLLGFYLLIIFGIFFFMLVLTILLLIQRESLIDRLLDYMDNGEIKDQLKLTLNSNIKAVSVAMIIFSLILVRTRSIFLFLYIYSSVPLSQAGSIVTLHKIVPKRLKSHSLSRIAVRNRMQP